jgi:hypothetical protein
MQCSVALSLVPTAAATTALALNLPTGATLLAANVYTTTAYTGTTVTVQAGSTVGAADYFAASASIKSLGVVSNLTFATNVAGILSLPAGTPNFFVTITQTGPTNVGAGQLVVEYVLN